jgi:hypothetical protein
MTRAAVIAAGGLWGFAYLAHAQPELLKNGGFEEGEKAPLGWALSAGGGAWLNEGGVGGGACVKVEGDGTSVNGWLSEPVAFLPSRVYRFSFSARGEEAGGGTVVSGPPFANVDVGVPGKAWTRYENVFAAPIRKDELTVPLRFGQWQLKGRAFFDEARLAQVEPVHAALGELFLGEGEKIEGTRYTFDAPFSGECRNHSRPLMWHTAPFNTDRWCFSDATQVTYRHALAGRKLLSGSLELSCVHFTSGKLSVDVSLDAKEWQHVGMVTNTGNVKMEVPAALFPAEAVYVRLRGAKESGLQIGGYTYLGATDGEPAAFTGSTRYIESESTMPRLKVQVLSLGAAVPGGDNCVDLRVLNTSGVAFPAEARVLFSRPGETVRTNTVAVTVPAGGAFELRAPYETPGVGVWQMTVELGGAFTARSSVRVPEFYDDAYGELIPANNPKLNVWRASSGWKIPRRRALPRQIAKSLALRLARNEWEALQLVVAPNVALSNLQVSASELVFMKNTIPRENIEVLRVGYVPVTKTTDKTGTLADWPDPLLPQSRPFNLDAGINQPFWIRVKAPKDVPPGIYRGTVTVEADGVKVTTVLNAEVYDFALPDTMTCETSFGFSPWTVWRYQNVTEPAQRREVLDKYLKSLAEHHISPYDPAPLDRWTVEWMGLNPWRGGVIDTTEKADGEGSLFVNDASERENVSASYKGLVPLPEKGFKIAFKHKTANGQKFLFALSYQKANGDWLPGCNTDLAIDGKTEWQSYETVQASFPKEAAACRFAVYAAGYQEPGVATGGLWLDSLKITDAATGNEVVEGGAFEPVDFAKVTPVFDWAKWDAAMTRAFDTYHFNSFVMHVDGLGGGTFQSRSEPSFLGYAESCPEYDLLLGKYLKGIEAHLREKGWLDKAYVYWFDEPDPKDYAFVMNGFSKLKKHAPGLRRMLTEQVEKDLVGGPNLWVPLTPSLNVAGLEERRAAGDQFWWYVCCGPTAPYATEFIDHPGTELRVWLWQTWAERVTGVLIWETVYWTSGTAYPDRANPQNPYLDPMCWVVDDKLAPGTKRPWGNGDGRFLYPPEAAADGCAAAPVLDGPVDTVRLELLRDGIEDYEYFVILKRLLAEKGAKLDPRTRANAEALLAVPADVSASLTSFTRDPATIEAHRDRLARAIVEWQKR